MFKNAQVNKYSLFIVFVFNQHNFRDKPYEYICGMEITLTAKLIFKSIANGVNGSLAIVLQRVGMELEKTTGSKNRKNSMEERHVRGMQKWQKHVPLGFVQVNAAKKARIRYSNMKKR